MDNVLEHLAVFLFFYLFQSLIYVYSIHLFSNHPVKLKPYLICSFLSMIATYIARSELTYGVHTLFSLIALILLAVGLLKIPAQKVVKSALLIAILTLIYELLISIIYTANIGKERYLDLLATDMGLTIIGTEINILLLITLIPVYIIKKRKFKRAFKGIPSGENNGENS